MNICIISYIYPIKSNLTLGIFVHNHAKELVKNNNEGFVLTTNPDKMCNEEVIDGVNIIRMDSVNGLVFSLKTIFKIIKNNKRYDIVHSHFLGISTIMVGLICKIIRLPYIVTSHGTSWEFNQKPMFRKTLIRLALSFPKKIICVSRKTKEVLEQYTNQYKLEIIPPGIALPFPTKTKEEFKKELNLDNKQIVLSVCDLVQKKGLDIIIKCMPELIKRFPDLYYIIVGEGDMEEELIELVNQLELQNHIIFTSFKQPKELVNYYNMCDVFVLMSRTIKNAMESFGIVYIEASYLGKPVIGGKGGGTSDSVEHGKSGYLVDPANPDEFIDKLSLLLENKSLRDRMGECGKQRVKQNFLWSHMNNKIIKIYEEVKKRK